MSALGTSETSTDVRYTRFRDHADISQRLRTIALRVHALIISRTLFFHLDLIGTFVGREPHHERWRHAVGGLELPERHADARPCKAIAPDCDHGWIFSRGDRRKHLLFEGVELGIPEILQHLLKSMVTGRLEWVRTPECILRRVGGIKMRTRNPALRDRLRGR